MIQRVTCFTVVFLLVGGLTVEAAEEDGVEAVSIMEEYKDIVHDLDTFLKAVGRPPLGAFADFNEHEYANVDGEIVRIYKPNGIPDWVEFALVRWLVEHPEVDWIRKAGVYGAEVKKAFEHNLGQAKIDFPIQKKPIHYTVAYYMTLGTLDSTGFVEDAVKEAWGLKLDRKKYDTSESKHFYADACLDGDYQFNIEEWKQSGYDVNKYIPLSVDGKSPPLINGVDENDPISVTLDIE